jgi:hypothetical protein
MRSITINIYQYDELSDAAKKKAIDEVRLMEAPDEWWHQEYEDAAQIGLKLTGFDLVVTGQFMEDACHTAHKIKDEHGETCGTYKVADEFLRERDEIVNTASKDENGEFDEIEALDDKLNEVERQFLKDLLHEYLKLLQSQYDYMYTDEYALDYIAANEPEFKENGTLYRKR